MRQKLGLAFIILLLMVNTACDPTIRSACRRDDSKDYEAFIGKDFSVYFGMEQGEVIEALRGEGYMVFPEEDAPAYAWVLNEPVGGQILQVRLLFTTAEFYPGKEEDKLYFVQVEKILQVRDMELNEQEKEFVQTVRKTLLEIYGESDPPHSDRMDDQMLWREDAQTVVYSWFEEDIQARYPGDSTMLYRIMWTQESTIVERAIEEDTGINR